MSEEREEEESESESEERRKKLILGELENQIPIRAVKWMKSRSALELNRAWHKPAVFV